VNTRPPVIAQRRFQRYVAVLLAATLPVLVVVEYLHAGSLRTSGLLISGYLMLILWGVYVARSETAPVVPLVLATIVFVGLLVAADAVFDTDVTALDFTGAFGLMLVLSVLSGGLVTGNRLVWAAGLALSVAIWVATMGFLEGGTVGTIAMRATVAIACVSFATALVSDLFHQLAEAIEEHRRSARLQDAIASCSEALLVHSDAFAVYEATRALLDAVDTDYAYVDRTVVMDGEPAWEIIADAGASVDNGGLWRKGVYSEIPTAYKALATGRAVIVKPGELDPEEGRPYIEDGIRSEVSVPIFVGAVMRGSVGFIQYSEERDWSESEIQTLWRASHMIAAYWKRQDDAEQLRASNESKDRLLASVSHEIRTPLTAIVGLSEELISSRTSLGAEEMDELNGIIAVQSRELAELVEDLLVASRADFGNLSIRPEWIDLRDQALRVVEGVRESHPARKEVRVEGGPVRAWADPLRVRQVIRNLLTNAVKYGGDRIVILLEERGELAAVTVADDGAGVPEHESQLIFERYYRSTGSPTQPGSVGIGLPVSRQLAEMMGGKLEYLRRGVHPSFELVLPASSEESDSLDGHAVSAPVAG
jgi:signal transduction histidine kinase